jgi:hypothetical protein
MAAVILTGPTANSWVSITVSYCALSKAGVLRRRELLRRSRLPAQNRNVMLTTNSLLLQLSEFQSR